MRGLTLIGCICLAVPGVRSGETCYEGAGGNLGTGDRASGHNLQWTKVIVQSYLLSLQFIIFKYLGLILGPPAPPPPLFKTIYVFS